MASSTSLIFSSFHPPFPFRSTKSLLYPSLPFSSSKCASFSIFRILCSPKSSYDSVSGEFGIISTTEKSDGSVLFQFGEVTEEISKNVQLGKHKITKKDNQEVKSYDERVDSVRENDLCLEGSNDLLKVEDSVLDVNSSDVHVLERINFNIATPLDQSKLDDSVGEEETELGWDTISSDKASQVESGDEVANELAESEVEMPTNVVPQAASEENSEDQVMNFSSISEDNSIQHMKENNVVDDGAGNGDLVEVVPASASLEAEAILDEEPTHNAVDVGSTSIATVVNEEPTGNAFDEEHISITGEPTCNAVDKELIHDAVHEELNCNALDVEPNHIAMDEEPTRVAADGGELANSVVAEEPTHNTVVEESTSNAIDEKPVHPEVFESLKMLDSDLLASSRAEEVAEGDAQSSNNVVSIPNEAESQMRVSNKTREEISMSRFFLFSGAASLPHPSKVERMHILLIKTGLVLLMELDSGHLKGLMLDYMPKS